MRRLGRNLRLRQIPDFINWLFRPDFFAPLTHTLLLTNGQGVATFTRATTATVTDFEGLLKTAKAGEPRFEGARRVENLVSSNLSTWSGSVNGTGLNPVITVNSAANPVDGLLTAYTVTLNRGAGNTLSDSSTLAYSSFSVKNGNQYVSKMHIKGVAGQQLAFRTVGGGAYTVITFTGSWQTITNSELALTPVFELASRGGIGQSTNSVTFNIYRPQLEDVTGQLVKAPSEDVSNGILSSPYHGANVDGVKYFDTLNGNTVSSSVVTEGIGTGIPETTLKGVEAEVASTNLFLQSKILATHSVTTTATTYTVSFTGTGTIVLSGTYTGTLVGTGTNNRVSLSFTATAGMLTATITGTCTNGQCEANPMATSYIPTTTSTVTRNADVLTFPNTGNVNDTAGTVLMEVTPAFDIPNSTNAGYGNSYIMDFGADKGQIRTISNTLRRYDGTTETTTPSWTPIKNTTYKIGSRWGSIGQRNWVNGVAGTNIAFDGSINSGVNMNIGGYGGGTVYNWGGTIKNLKIYKKVLSDAQIQQQTIQA